MIAPRFYRVLADTVAPVRLRAGQVIDAKAWDVDALREGGVKLASQDEPAWHRKLRALPATT